MSPRTFVLLTILLCGCAVPAAGAEPTSASPGVSRALLIGINRYSAVPSLQGSINDVETMREVLTTRWGFPSSSIEMLLDDRATRAGILAALGRLVSDAGPDDAVYVHYSGHGSQVQDLNGDESDGLDETLVAQDGRSGDVPDIVDDELDTIFAKLRARRAVIVLDSCHSGTATRAFDIRARSVPPDTRLSLYRTGVPATSMRAIVPLRRSKFVVMSGAASNEEALDGPVEGRYHGFFTYSLSRSFMSARPGASPRQIFSGVASELGRIQTSFGRSSMPEPQLEGPPEAMDSPLFARVASAATQAAAPAATQAAVPDAARLAWLLARPAGNGAITLMNGVLLSAMPGSTWAVYGPNETRFTPGRALGVATVTGLDGNNATASMRGTSQIPPDSRAIALMPAPSSQRIAIRFGDVPLAQQAVIKELLSRKVPTLEWVAPQQRARFVVDLHGNTVRLLSADGLYTIGSFTLDDERAIANVARLASRSTPAAELLSLENASSRLTIEARVVGAPNPTPRDIVLVADTAPARLHSRRPGEPRSSQNSLQLSITVSEDAYLTIVDVDTEGATNLLFPNPHQRTGFVTNGAVRRGQEVVIPDSLQPGNRAGFYWDYGPPPGVDTVRVFATTDLATAELIRRRINALQPTSASSRGEPAARALANDLSPLRTELTQLAARGISVVADDTSPAAAPEVADWAAVSVTIEVAE